MIRNALILLFFLFSSVLFAVDTTTTTTADPYNVEYSPPHLYINKDGKITITFDVPESTVVETASIELKSRLSATYNVVDQKITSDLSLTDNTLTLEASDIYDQTLLASSHSFFAESVAGDVVSDSDTLSDEDVVSDADAIPDKDTADKDAIPDSDKVIPNDSDVLGEYSKDGKYTARLVIKIKGTTEKNDDDNDSDTKSSTTTTSSTSVKIYDFTVNYDNTAPADPAKIETEPANKSIVVTLTAPKKDVIGKPENIGGYFISVKGIFLFNGAEKESTQIYKVETTSETAAFTLKSKGGYDYINNDSKEEKYEYEISAYAFDRAGNSNEANIISTRGSAMTTEGFWTHYKKAGGKDDGGYCFIATASYGSYFHPFVKVLRQFRDKVLLNTDAGTAFVKGYYKNGPAMVSVLENHTWLKPVVRVGLLPFVAFAFLILNPLYLLLLSLFATSFFLLRKHKKALFMLAFLFMLPGQVQAGGDFFFSFSLYNPKNIDENTDAEPFYDIAGESKRVLPSMGFGVDIPLPDFIKATVRGSAGYIRFKGNSVYIDGTESPDTTKFNIIPLMAEIKIRPQYKFPIRPYVSAGLDYDIWWIRESGKTAEDGATHGYHYTFGAQMSLNWMEPKSAIKLKESTGLTDSSIFIHYRIEKINDFNDGKSFDLSMNRLEFGLTFDY